MTRKGDKKEDEDRRMIWWKSNITVSMWAAEERRMDSPYSRGNEWTKRGMEGMREGEGRRKMNWKGIDGERLRKDEPMMMKWTDDDEMNRGWDEPRMWWTEDEISENEMSEDEEMVRRVNELFQWIKARRGQVYDESLEMGMRQDGREQGRGRGRWDHTIN